MSERINIQHRGYTVWEEAAPLFDKAFLIRDQNPHESIEVWDVDRMIEILELYREAEKLRRERRGGRS